MSKIKLRWPRFFARAPKKEPQMKALTQRVDRAAESILENEGLAADLDDAAAKVLLDWGIACAKMVAQSTADLGEAEAEEAMSTRLRATRRLMRSVNTWVASRREMDAEGSAMLLAKILEQAAIIYGKDFTSLDDDQRYAFLKQHIEFADTPQQLIANLRGLLESSSGTSIANQGGK
jgi:hypothetical protein